MLAPTPIFLSFCFGVNYSQFIFYIRKHLYFKRIILAKLKAIKIWVWRLDFLFRFVYYSNHDVNEYKSPKLSGKSKTNWFRFVRQKGGFCFLDTEYDI